MIWESSVETLCIRCRYVVIRPLPLSENSPNFGLFMAVSGLFSLASGYSSHGVCWILAAVILMLGAKALFTYVNMVRRFHFTSLFDL